MKRITGKHLQWFSSFLRAAEEISWIRNWRAEPIARDSRLASGWKPDRTDPRFNTTLWAESKRKVVFERTRARVQLRPTLRWICNARRNFRRIVQPVPRRLKWRERWSIRGILINPDRAGVKVSLAASFEAAFTARLAPPPPQSRLLNFWQNKTNDERQITLWLLLERRYSDFLRKFKKIYDVILEFEWLLY